MEENKHNPTISVVHHRPSKNHFLLKYNSEEQRLAWSDMILMIAKNHELKDFHIEEKKAYEEPRVLYNLHTVLHDGEFSFDILEKRFLKYYEDY